MFLVTSGRRVFRGNRSNARSRTSSSCPLRRRFTYARIGASAEPTRQASTFPTGGTSLSTSRGSTGKRVGFRIMLENPDFPDPGMPAFLMEKVPYVPLKGSWPGDRVAVRYRKKHAMPRYDHPAYLAAFEELNALLADAITAARTSSTWTP